MSALWPLLILLASVLQAPDLPPALGAAVKAYVEKRGGKAYVEKRGGHELPPLRYGLADLDGDEHPDAIVLLEGRDWCGSGGCTLLIFRAVKDSFALLSGSTITYEPIRVSPETTHGWKTLIVFSNGTGNVVMRFSGRRYPPNPSLQPKATPAQVEAAQVVIGPTQ